MSDLLAAAVDHHRAGRLDDAERLYLEVLAGEPRHADALQFLGLIALARGDAAGAAARIREALVLNPGAAVYYFNLGKALKQAGDAAGALESYRKAAELAPRFAEAHNNLGNALRDAGDAAGAAASLQKAVALRPDYPEAHLNLAAALSDLGQLDEAEQSLRSAIAIRPDLAEAHFNLGNVLLNAGRPEESAQASRRALELRPDHTPSMLTLGNALQANGRYAEAIATFEKARERQPDTPEILNNIGNGWFALGDRKAAIAWCRKALKLKPDYALVWNNLGVALQQEGQIDEAIAAYHKALSIAPTADACNNLGLALPIIGEYGEAEARFRQAIGLRDDFVAARRNALGVMLYDPAATEESLWTAHEEFGAAMAARVKRKLPPPLNDRAPERRLRVGYVSSDFYEHPVGRNLEPVLTGRDKDKFEVFAYSDVGAPDLMTGRLKTLVDHWRSSIGMTDDALARQVRVDQIDILVLLAGRFDKNRPQVACWRPAPVQVSFHDPASSGIAEMDYLIADPVLAPKDTAERFSERVVRLPGFYIHAPLDRAPAVGALPAAAAKGITFGSFNNPAKLNPAALRLWGRVLEAVPGSRLTLKFKNWFGIASQRERILRGVGVAPERITFMSGDEAQDDHLALYNGVDIALDPFPFTGSTTTFEALWMGAPVVTLAGGRMVARWSAAMLHKLGLDELIATTPDAYVAKAAALAADIPRLQALRGDLRARVARSPLCDGPAKARQVERLYRAMWRRWCAQA